MKKNDTLALQIFIAFLAGLGLGQLWFSNQAPDPLMHATADFVKVSVDKEKLGYDREKFALLATECGTQQDIDHLERLAEKFEGVKKTVYKFKYTKDSQDPDSYYVTRVPNKAGYGTMGDFQHDFNICAGGAMMYPKMLNQDWLLFVSSCGTGVDDGTGRPNGCEEVRKVIEPSLNFR